MKEQYVETHWRVDEKGILHMEFPIQLFLHVQDADWVAYKNGIIAACQQRMKEKQ